MRKLLKALAFVALTIASVVLLFFGVAAIVGLSPPAALVTAFVTAAPVLGVGIVTLKKIMSKSAAYADARGAPTGSKNDTYLGSLVYTFAAAVRRAISSVVPARVDGGMAAVINHPSVERQYQSISPRCSGAIAA